MAERRVRVRMRVRFDQRLNVLVLMMGVVHVQMLMLERFVLMHVAVTLAQQQRDAHRHRGACDEIGGSDAFAKERDSR